MRHRIFFLCEFTQRLKQVIQIDANKHPTFCATLGLIYVNKQKQCFRPNHHILSKNTLKIYTWGIY